MPSLSSFWLFGNPAVPVYLLYSHTVSLILYRLQYAVVQSTTVSSEDYSDFDKRQKRIAICVLFLHFPLPLLRALPFGPLSLEGSCFWVSVLFVFWCFWGGVMSSMTGKPTSAGRVSRHLKQGHGLPIRFLLCTSNLRTEIRAQKRCLIIFQPNPVFLVHDCSIQAPSWPPKQFSPQPLKATRILTLPFNSIHSLDSPRMVRVISLILMPFLLSLSRKP